MLLEEIQELIKSDRLSGFTATPEGHHGGEKVQRLEQAVRDRFGVAHAIAFNSATSALHAACVAASRIRGRRFAVTPFSFTASVSCVLMAGEPMLGKGIHFVDIEDKTYCMNPDLIPDEVDVIIPVHLFGHPADMDKIMAKGKFVIEDAAQAIGAKYKGKWCGTIGDCGVFSFNQNKQISCGEGGVLITNNDDVAYITRLVRNHGEVVDDSRWNIVGYNYRMTEIEAIIAWYRLLELDNVIKQRQRGMAEIEWHFGKQRTCGIGEHGAYVYPIRVEDNKKVAEGMTKRGFPLRPGYLTKPLHKIPMYDGHSDCPVTDRLWSKEIIVTDIIKEPFNVIHKFCTELEDIIHA